MEQNCLVFRQNTISEDTNGTTDKLVDEFLGIYFPNIEISDNTRQLLAEKFKNNGVSTKEDFDYIEGEDFLNILTTIQIRKFLKKKEHNASPQCKEFLSETEQSTSGDSSSSFFPITPAASPAVSSINDNINKAGWAENVDLESSFAKVPTIKMVLDRGKKITSEQRRSLVRVIVEDLRKISQKISSQHFRIIAKRITEKYAVLKDELDGLVIGTGYGSICNQLINKNDNCNRSKNYLKRSNSSDGETPSTSTKLTPKMTSKDSYGCINFNPGIANADCLDEIRQEMVDMSKCQIMNWVSAEYKLKESYPLQRHHINNGKSVRELLSKWPLLFKMEGIFLHFELLTGLELTKTTEPKQRRLVNFFTTGLENNMQFSQLLQQIVKHFNEDLEHLILIVDDTMTPSEVEKMNDRETPRIAVLGASMENGSDFLILVDNTVIATCKKFHTAFLAFFALFYVLNIEYPPGMASTLEFFQRCLVGINPLTGSKSAKKKRGNMNPKVLKLINEISSFEWIS